MMTEIEGNLDRVIFRDRDRGGEVGTLPERYPIGGGFENASGGERSRSLRCGPDSFWRKPGSGSSCENSVAALEPALAFHRASSKNKIRHALPLFELLQSIDSLALAQDVDKIAGEDGLRPHVLLEVNIAGRSNYGFQPDALRAQLEALLQLNRLTIEGLMTIPPLALEAESSRKYFAALRELRDVLER